MKALNKEQVNKYGKRANMKFKGHVKQIKKELCMDSFWMQQRGYVEEKLGAVWKRQINEANYSSSLRSRIKTKLEKIWLQGKIVSRMWSVWNLVWNDDKEIPCWFRKEIRNEAMATQWKIYTGRFVRNRGL